MAKVKSYSRDQSPLYKVRGYRQLSSALAISPAQLRDLCKAKSNYRRWTDKKSHRAIQEPKPLLDRVHRRVARLLSRIDTPEYLESAVKGRSYLSNAAKHAADQPTIKIDIKSFYTSARSQEVFQFFAGRMEFEPDIAGVLSCLLTVDGHLPTGSSASPILSFFAYEKMFDEIVSLALEYDCVMSVYVDDIAITGPGASRELLYRVRGIIGRYHLKGHKSKLFKPFQPKVVTGVTITQYGRDVPLRRQQKIAEAYSELKAADDVEGQLTAARRLAGRLHEAAQINPDWTTRANEAARQLNALEHKCGPR